MKSGAEGAIAWTASPAAGAYARAACPELVEGASTPGDGRNNWGIIYLIPVFLCFHHVASSGQSCVFGAVFAWFQAGS
jgi:hypothetical protein